MSTIRVNAIQSTSTTDGGISIDSSGNITLPANTKVGTQNLPSAGPLSNRNLIINGAMQVAQRGTSSTSTGYGTVDRFRSSVNEGTVTKTQESLTSGDPYNEGFRYFHRSTNTTASSNDAPESRSTLYYMEAQDIASSGWNYASSDSNVTLSFWVRSSIAGTYYGQFRTMDGTSQGYSFSYTLSADTWTKVTKTIPGNSSITIDNDNGVGLQIWFNIHLGTNFTDSGHTLESWAAWDSTSLSPVYTHDWSGTTDATFDLTGVQLEVGSVATPFEQRSYGDELAKCQRYYWNVFLGDTSANNTIAQGTNYNGTTSFFDLYPPVAMRTAPSLEASNTANYYVAYESGSGTGVSTITPDSTTTPNVFEVSAACGGSSGNAVIFRRQNAAAILRFSAEL
jgi:hypothetical protein